MKLSTSTFFKTTDNEKLEFLEKVISKLKADKISKQYGRAIACEIELLNIDGGGEYSFNISLLVEDIMELTKLGGTK